MKKLTLFLLVVLILNSAFLIRNCEAQWVQMSNGMGTNLPILTFLSIGNNIFAGTDGLGIYRSTNNGGNWTSVNSGLTNPNVADLIVLGNNIFAGTLAGVFRSTNNGDSWTAVNSGLTNLKAYTFIVSGTNIFTGTFGGGVFLSTNNGTSWNPVNNGLTNLNIMSLLAVGTDIFAGTIGGGIFRSTNNGGNWSPVNSGLPLVPIISTLAVNGTNIFAGAFGGGVFRSTNNGGNWSTVNSGLTNDTIISLSVSGTYIFAGTFGGGIFISANNGGSWIKKNQGFTVPQNVWAILIANNYIFAGTQLYSVWRRSYTEIIGIQNIITEIPSMYSLSQNYPNPFNPTTLIKFAITKLSDVKIVVYDAKGREVQTLVNESLKPGTYETSFDGSLLGGSSTLNSGVYFYKMMTEGFTETKKMMMIK